MYKVGDLFIQNRYKDINSIIIKTKQRPVLLDL